MTHNFEFYVICQEPNINLRGLRVGESENIIKDIVATISACSLVSTLYNLSEVLGWFSMIIFLTIQPMADDHKQSGTDKFGSIDENLSVIVSDHLLLVGQQLKNILE